MKTGSGRNGFHTTAPFWMVVFSTASSMEEVSTSARASAINDGSGTL
jgi:hypothetical protein